TPVRRGLASASRGPPTSKCPLARTCIGAKKPLTVFFRSKKPPQEPAFDLATVVAQCLPEADAETVYIVTSDAGLLGCIGYADRDVTERESHMVRNLLQTVQGLGALQADAILSAIERNINSIST